jgi:hypothetical protein
MIEGNKMALTIAYITSRNEPHFEWFLDSLYRQLKDDLVKVIIVDGQRQYRPTITPLTHPGGEVLHTQPKPTIWQGDFRITKTDWWAASNSRNTALCLCETDWIAFLDDRCVLMPGWYSSIKQAMKHGYAVFGSYEKRTGMTVENGVIKHGGIVIGKDSRVGNDKAVVRAPGEWSFGCTLALPAEWMLQVNGYDESCDGSGFEDIFLGLMLQNNGFPMMYDKRMKMVEDRTPEYCGPVMRKEDKGVSPDDKSHAMVNMLRFQKKALHFWNNWDMRAIRSDVQDGKPFPLPEEREYRDWWDNTVINGI